jgi:hypothetical protein
MSLESKDPSSSSVDEPKDGLGGRSEQGQIPKLRHLNGHKHDWRLFADALVFIPSKKSSSCAL